MDYIKIASFLFMFGASSSQEYTPPRIKEIPEAPKLAELNYNKLPEYVRHQFAPADFYKEKKNTKRATSEEMQLKTPKTYGMSIFNDRGFAWNNLTEPGIFYEVGETNRNLENNEEQKNTVLKKEDNLTTVVVKDTTPPKYDQPTTYKLFHETTTIHIKNQNTNENNSDTSANANLKVEESMTNNLTPNNPEKLMQDIEKIINEFVETLNNSAVQDLSKQKKPSDCNCTSDVTKIPLPELQSIFDDIIKNYSTIANPNTTTVKDDSIKPNAPLFSNQKQNTGLELSNNETETETTSTPIDVDSNLTTVYYNPTTETIMIDKDNSSEIKITHETSNVKELDDSKDSDLGLADDSNNEKENESNNTLINQMIDATTVLKELTDNEVFRQLVNVSITNFLEPFVKRLAREIKDEVATQLQDYFRSIKNTSNQSNTGENYPNKPNNAINLAELEQIGEIKPSIDKENSKLFTYSNETITNRFKEPNEISTESNLQINPMPQKIVFCEACKVIFNLKLNTSNNYVNAHADDKNDILSKRYTTENSIRTENLSERYNRTIKPDTHNKVDDNFETKEVTSTPIIHENNRDEKHNDNINVNINRDEEFVEQKFIPKVTRETYFDSSKMKNKNYRQEPGNTDLELGILNNKNSLSERSPLINVPLLRVNL